MSEPQPAAKELPARPSKPPKPTKALKPPLIGASRSKTLSLEVNQTVETGNNADAHLNHTAKAVVHQPSHSAPPAPPKPRILKREEKVKEDDNANQSQGPQAEDGKHSVVNEKIDSSFQPKINTPTGSPKLPPRRSKTPKINDDDVKDTSLDSADCPLNGESESKIISQNISEKCNNGERGELPTTKPKPPRKIIPKPSIDVVDNHTTEVSEGQSKNVGNGIIKNSQGDSIKESSSEQINSGPDQKEIEDPTLTQDKKEHESENGNTTLSLQSELKPGKKIALKPKPLRPPPPTRQSSIGIQNKIDSGAKEGKVNTTGKAKPPPPKPKPLKTPKLANRVHSQLKEGGGQKPEKVESGNIAKDKLESGSTGQNEPQPPPRRKRTSMIIPESQVDTSLENVELVNREKSEENAKEEHLVKPSEFEEVYKLVKEKPKRPNPPTPVPNSFKRSSTGTMFAVIGEIKKIGEELDKAENMEAPSASPQENKESEEELKPRRVAPPKPPLPNPVLVKQRSVAKKTPNSSPVKQTQKAGSSPKRVGSIRPVVSPPPPPPSANMKKNDRDMKGSKKVPPKRPPPLGKKTEGSFIKVPEENKKEKSGVQNEESEDSTPSNNEEVINNNVFNNDGPPSDGPPSDGTLLDGTPVEVEATEGEKEDQSSISEHGSITGNRDDDSFSSEEDTEAESEVCPEADDDVTFMNNLPKKEKKAYQVAKEIRDSEAVFVNVLKLLNESFKSHIDFARKDGEPVIEKEVLDQILGYLPQLQLFNEALLVDLKKRVKEWPDNPKISDVFIKIGPFLKLYTTYIQGFEEQTGKLNDACQKYPNFGASVKEFEATKQCQNLQVCHYMLKPVQRIPQYRLLLTDYQKNLEPGSVDEEDTKTALIIVSEVARHVNNTMNAGDNFEKLLNIQHSLRGQHDIISPGRTFIKEGNLLKISRKEQQPRRLYLLSDVLLTTASIPSGIGQRLTASIPITGIKVTPPIQTKDHENEFNIISIERSFTLCASTPEEKEEWIDAINEAVAAVIAKENTFKPTEEQAGQSEKVVLGDKAPVWIPDTRVTMCQICLNEFTMTKRRHHCRACGQAICGPCSSKKAKLRYSGKSERVCDDCYLELSDTTESDRGGSELKRTPSSVKSKSKSILVIQPTDTDIITRGHLHYKEKKTWKKMWYVIKGKVLYTYRASEDRAALHTFPLLGFKVERNECEIKLTQANIIKMFKADSILSAEDWTAAFEAAAML